MKKTYQINLNKLQKLMNEIENTPYTMWAKVVALTQMNMRYERKIMIPLDLSKHPYSLTKNIIKDTQKLFENLIEIGFVESKKENKIKRKSKEKEEKHEELFNEIWNRYDKEDFQEYIKRYIKRLKLNNIDKLIEGKKCIDLGCGNGVTCFALSQLGAEKVVGIDYGEKSIKYAKKAAKELGFIKTSFFVRTVYDTGESDSQYDFAIQNGVFHHLNDENCAIKEVRRILKNKGSFWYYTDGEGGIQYDLWDTSVEILREVPTLFIEEVLNSMNVSRNKIAHLLDGMGATYAHTSWDEITNRLADHGFTNFKRLTGGYDTDCDLDRIEKDAYGKEKFGEGDLRILCQLDK